MSILEKQYEAKHIELMRKGYDDLARMMKVTADQLAIKIHSLQAKRELHPSKYGSQLKRNERLLKQIELAFKSLENDLLSGLEAQMTEQWKLANTKNFILTKQFLGAVKKKYNKPNYEALAAFQKRNINGMNLSDRIHNLTETTKQIYMDYIGSGITQGKSAISIARDLNAINSDPKNVTVYDKKGNPVKLGKISTILQPDAKGRGIFKKPLKNLFRLTRTETNAAYRLADHERIQQLDFVVGFEVHLSKSHKLVDMCDFLAGVYPKTFVFSGWHPSCLCYVTTILKTREEFNKDLPSSREVKQIPVSAQRYVKTEDMSRYDWHKANFNEKNEPTERVGGPSKNIEPYKISVKSRDYRPQENILVNAGKL